MIVNDCVIFPGLLGYFNFSDKYVYELFNSTDLKKILQCVETK